MQTLVAERTDARDSDPEALPPRHSIHIDAVTRSLAGNQRDATDVVDRDPLPMSETKALPCRQLEHCRTGRTNNGRTTCASLSLSSPPAFNFARDANASCQ